MFQQQDTQTLHLIPTRFAHVFNVQLSLPSQTRYIGKLDEAGEGTFSSKRSEKHLHRKTNSIGVNLELLHRFQFKWIVMFFCCEELVTTKNFMLHHGKVLSFDKAGFERQCFLSLDLWGEEQAIEFERALGEQGELFTDAA